jgi:hypothetical protein
VFPYFQFFPCQLLFRLECFIRCLFGSKPKSDHFVSARYLVAKNRFNEEGSEGRFERSFGCRILSTKRCVYELLLPNKAPMRGRCRMSNPIIPPSGRLFVGRNFVSSGSDQKVDQKLQLRLRRGSLWRTLIVYFGGPAMDRNELFGKVD